MIAKRTSWNEFSLSMASAIICLSSGRKFNVSKYIFDSLVRNVDSPTKFYVYPRFLQLMIRKQVGDLSTHTTKYTSPTLTQKVFSNMRRVGDVTAAHEEVLMVAEQPSIPSPTPPTPPPQPSQDIPLTSQLKKRVKKLKRRNKVRVMKLRRLQRVGTALRVETFDEIVLDDVSNQGRMIAEMNYDTDVVLEDDKEVADVVKDVQESSQD
nr:hypothetical protein [Tanacetum cinerariifolium]